MLTPVPGVQRRMLFEGMSAKKRLPSTHTGPSTQVNPVAMRSSIAPAGTIRSMDGSRRSTLSGDESRMPSDGASDGTDPAVTRLTAPVIATPVNSTKNESSQRELLRCIVFS